MLLQGKVAAVTGGTKGIGRAIAEAFLEEGARVSISGRGKESGEKALREIGAGDRLIYIESDGTKPEAVDQFLDETVSSFGVLDILVNNVGRGMPAPLGDSTNEMWDVQIAMNLSSAFYGTRKALKLMVPRGTGRIINIASVAGKKAIAGIGIYSAAKHGLIGLTRATALEYAQAGITANAICPGPIPTEMVREAARELGITEEQFFAPILALTQTKKYNTAEQIAKTAVLLASEAGAGITGTAISVDGGISMD